MNVKDYLSHLRVLSMAIRTLTEEIAALNIDMMSPGAVRYDKINVQTSPKDLMAEKEIAVDEKRLRLKEKRREYESFREQIIDQIVKMDDGTQAEVLMRTYVKRQSVRKIAQEMNYSERNIIRIKRAALMAFDKKYKIYEVVTFCHL